MIVWLLIEHEVRIGLTRLAVISLGPEECWTETRAQDGLQELFGNNHISVDIVSLHRSLAGQLCTLKREKLERHESYSVTLDDSKYRNATRRSSCLLYRCLLLWDIGGRCGGGSGKIDRFEIIAVRCNLETSVLVGACAQHLSDIGEVASKSGGCHHGWGAKVSSAFRTLATLNVSLSFIN